VSGGARPVTLRLEETGSVTVGEPHVAPAGLGLVGIPGGLVLVDPTDAGATPVISVSDAAAAHEVLAEMLGPAVADAAAGLERHEPGATLEILSTPAEPVTWVEQLGILRWLDASAPWPLDDPLLRLERAVLTLRCGGLADEEATAASELLEDAEAVVASLEVPEAPPAVERLLLEAAGYLEGLLLIDDPRLAALRAARRLAADGSARWPSPVVDVPMVQSSCTPRAPAYAGGELRDELVAFSCAADWTRVRRGVVGRDETSVTWAIEPRPASGAFLSVSVEARADLTSSLPLFPAAAAARELAFSVHVPGWPAPVAAGTLVSRPDWGTWMGGIELSPPAEARIARVLERGDAVTLDVHERGREPVRGADAVTAEAVRWSARGAMVRRLESVEALSAAAAAAYGRAQRLWRAAPVPEAERLAARCRELARDDARGTTPSLTVTELLSSAPR
jgi:hypothetical protein